MIDFTTIQQYELSKSMECIRPNNNVLSKQNKKLIIITSSIIIAGISFMIYRYWTYRKNQKDNEQIDY